MSEKFSLVSDIKDASDNKSYRICVRVLRLWRVPLFNDRQQNPMLEMVVIDEQTSRIACSIKSHHVKFFDNQLMEGKVYIISNYEVLKNDIRFKPTRHDFRIIFKRETQLRQTENCCIPTNAFNFVPNHVILSETKEDSYLLDVIGVLTAKGNLSTHVKDGKNLKYIKLELDDPEDHQKIRCTLWEEFALQFDKHFNECPATEYVIVLQFAKFKQYQGKMGVSNTNYTSRLFINEDFSEVKQFRQRLCQNLTSVFTQVTQIDNEPSYSMEDDLLHHHVYKPICDLKDANEGEKTIFITFGTVKEIETEYSWWYKACKQCFQGLKEHTKSFHCKRCNTYPNTFIPRYSIRLRVEDETDSASFIVYDREAANFLNITANDLRAAHIARGGQKKDYPGEINAFMDRKFIFKVCVKIDDLNSFQPCVITVLKLCSDESIISSFKDKYKINDLGFLHDNSELQSTFADGSDIMKETLSQTCENAGDFEVETSHTPTKTTNEDSLINKASDKSVDLQLTTSFTPSKTIYEEGWVAKASESSHDDFDHSSTKMRKVLKEHED